MTITAGQAVHDVKDAIAVDMRDAVGSRLILALEQAWSAIRERHPEVPPAVMITASRAQVAGLRFGRFAASRWRIDQLDGALSEVFIGGEGLARSPERDFATLLHEAIHALAHVREIKDTSRQGRYHNKRFKLLAQELGIDVSYHQHLGFSATTLPPATSRRYASTLRTLRGALDAHRDRELALQHEQTASPDPPSCICRCGRLIRVAPGTLAQGPILCSICRQPFRRRT
jgi:hypothetical protein